MTGRKSAFGKYRYRNAQTTAVNGTNIIKKSPTVYSSLVSGGFIAATNRARKALTFITSPK